MSMVENRHAIAGGAPCLVGAAGRKDQHARVGVLEVEAELVFLYAGFSGAAVPATDAARNDTIIGSPLGSAMPTRSPRLTPAAAKLFRDGLHLVAQRRIGDVEVLFRKDDGGLAGGARSNKSDNVDGIPASNS